ncbi:hypothetical protein [Bartonella harrusi]|uniref:Uncharacterized protein n=1 Tax=Bartonella harrusi TaxID=2961895 RepID=A0ABY5EW07_9HYPH|nr:hypothetical protein [Bartonella harrusi]UTO29280.1 hypothetical protein NMK50_04990 [Bartonella harrusi]
MRFLQLSCKKEDFFPFTFWLLLSGFGMLLINNLEADAYLIKQPQENNIVKTKCLDPQDHQLHRLNTLTTENKNFATFHTNPILPNATFQNILTLNLFLIVVIVICTPFRNLKTQYFSNKRAPPLD